MCALHAQRKETAKEAESRKLADTSCAFQLTAFEKCCNITKVVVGKVKYILCTCIFAYECKKCIL
jgi:hypothetical protein